MTYWSLSDKVKHLLDKLLDRIAEIIYWPVLELDPVRASLWMQVWHIVWKIGMEAMLDRTLDREIARERDRERVLI